MWPFPAFAATALALLIERLTGYPDTIYRAIGHPVEWIGRLITVLDERLNDPALDDSASRMRGVTAVAVLLLVCLIPSWIIANLLARVPFGWVIEALLATSLIAQTSLRNHVTEVATGLGQSLDDGRQAVSQIVGRDPYALDESGVARAALESLAENTSDGIVAPALWFAILGLPGLVLYKAINTADSMIGHKTVLYLNFGRAAARLDDLVNLPASRLTGLLFALAAGSRWHQAVEAMRRDAKLHRSPNAGWPEAAMAGALRLRFGGPRSYGDETIDLSWMGDGREDLTRNDITAGLDIYDRALNWLLALTVLCAAAAWIV